MLEILHYFIPERSFEISDLFGNFIGVIIITIIVYFFIKNENIKN
jgi:VanZ family protein